MVSRPGRSYAAPKGKLGHAGWGPGARAPPARPTTTKSSTRLERGAVPLLDVRPFRGIRYSSKAAPLDRVVSPPYDVISPEERERLAQSSPYNVVRIDLPE